MTTRKTRSDRQPAPGLPVARVCVDVPLSHLDRLFDYKVSAEQDSTAQPGVRVRVRFAGQLVDGWLIERAEESEHLGKLAWLERVVSPEPVLRPEIAALARAVADRYAGSLIDVLRLAVPPRQAAVEKEPPADRSGLAAGDNGSAVSGGSAGEMSAGDAGQVVAAGDDGRAVGDGSAVAEVAAGGRDAAGDSALGVGRAVGGDPAVAEIAAGDSALGVGRAVGGDPAVAEIAAGPWLSFEWARYQAGTAFVRALAQGREPRAVWSALPGEEWPARFAEAIAATVQSGRGAVAVVPDARDLNRLDEALTKLLGPDRHVALSAALGPTKRYRRFLRLSRGEVTVAIGTRAAAFAPVGRLGLVAIWDDGDDVHAEPRAPYPHARQVLLTRAQSAGAAVLLGGFARTAEAQQLLATGWAKEIVASRDMLRDFAPEVRPADDRQLARDPAAASARLPSVAWQAAREAVRAGEPVLIQVPRRGYVPSVSCQDCRERARCPHCAGPLSLGDSGAPPSCRWCARPAAGFVCPVCGGRRLRAAVTGVRRTAEEIGRALPDIPVWTSGGETVLERVAAQPALVLATPGAEPVADGGYGAVLLLDTWALLTRADLRAGEEAARRWFAAAALVKPKGTVVVVADGALAAVQALIRWDPGWLAERELAERRELRFPPVAAIASVTGVASAVNELLGEARLPEDAELLGPLPVGQGQERMLVRVRRSAGARLAESLHAAAGVRSARKAAEVVRVHVDPVQL
ncbi:MAG TPA: primosomal protein N' [Candidatus Limnocylindrales bacterium]|nr:primosomal protein N' [Candidatus Limnocylindrales bacterium]